MVTEPKRLRLTFAERAELTRNAVAKKVFHLMSAKESNLCAAIDETNPTKFMLLVEALGPHCAVIKTHIETLEGFSGRITVDLANLAREHNFLVFEDRKFADVGQTVKNQYTKGTFHIIEWADIVNAHAIPGPGMIEGLRDEVREYELLDDRGLLLLAQMSSAENLIDDDYTRKVVKLADRYDDFVIGFIGAGTANLPVLAEAAAPGFLIFAPGVNLDGTGKPDHFGQQYERPEDVIAAGADLIVVGRDIYTHAKPISRAKEYRKVAWDAYHRRIEQPKARKTKVRAA